MLLLSLTNVQRPEDFHVVRTALTVDMNSLILAVVAPANTGLQDGPLTFEYVIPIFLIMIFAAALFSSKTKIPHTMILLGFGVCISFITLKGLAIPNFLDIS